MHNWKTSFFGSEKIPFVIEPKDENISLLNFLKILQEESASLKHELLKYGALLFRGFPIDGAKDFARVIKSLSLGKCIDYIGGDSPRKKIIDGVYTSTEAPPSFKIPLHNELSFSKNFPSHICFYCEIPPDKKGKLLLQTQEKYIFPYLQM